MCIYTNIYKCVHKYVFASIYLLKQTKWIHIYKEIFSAFNKHTQPAAILEDKTRWRKLKANLSKK